MSSAFVSAMSAAWHCADDRFPSLLILLLEAAALAPNLEDLYSQPHFQFMLLQGFLGILSMYIIVCVIPQCQTVHGNQQAVAEEAGSR